jgi:uncharacterized protein (DUF608 family)
MAIPTRLFPENLPPAEWHTFSAAGYHQPVTGVIYRGQPRPTCGMPLGGLDTGCLDIEPNGFLGYSTIFNHLVNPRLLLNLPFLGLSVGGQTWILASDLLAKQDVPRSDPDAVTFPALDYSPQYDTLQFGEADFQLAKSIDYWGHYPVLDLEFETSAPVSLGARLWSPFIPGDEAASMTPGFVCEFHLHNATHSPQDGSLVFSFPGFELPADPDIHAGVQRQLLEDGNLRGVQVFSNVAMEGWKMSYLVAMLDSPPPVPGPPSSVLKTRTGGPLNTNGQAWSSFNQALPSPASQETGASLAVDFSLSAGESRAIRIVFTWHAPHWRAGGSPSHSSSNAFTHRYTIHHPSALAAAQFLAEHHTALLQRVIAWQEAIHQHPEVPGWLADALVNFLHLLPECSVWAQAKPPVGDWCDPAFGIFALNECPRGCPQMECLPCSFYGNLPVVYFFPQAARSTLEAYKAYQFPDGRPPWIFGGVTANQPDNRDPYDLSHPDTGYQTVLNGACVIIMADRYWRSTGDDGFLREYWDSLKRGNDFSLNLRPAFGDAQVIAMPQPGTDNYVLGDTEWFEAPEPGWKGFVTHAGGVRLAQVGIMQRMACYLGDQDYAARCERWLQAGSHALEQHLWDGRADTQFRHYLNFNDPDSGQRSDLVFGYQLDGQWIADYHGIPPVFPPERARQALETIRQANCRLSQSGATNYANPDGSPARVGGYGTYGYFPPELYMLACTYLYAGEREFGLGLLKRCLENIVRWGYLWDMPNVMRGDIDTGERAFGADYYQNLMLWALPAALAGGDMTLPLGEDGLVARVLKAGKRT